MILFLMIVLRSVMLPSAIDVLKRTGAGCFMAKTDVKSVFRIIPIDPNDYPLLGVK